MDSNLVLKLISSLKSQLDTLESAVGGGDSSMADDSLGSMDSDPDDTSPLSSSAPSPMKGGLAALVLEKAKAKKGM